MGQIVRRGDFVFAFCLNFNSLMYGGSSWELIWDLPFLVLKQIFGFSFEGRFKNFFWTITGAHLLAA